MTDFKINKLRIGRKIWTCFGELHSINVFHSWHSHLNGKSVAFTILLTVHLANLKSLSIEWLYKLKFDSQLIRFSLIRINWLMLRILNELNDDGLKDTSGMKVVQSKIFSHTGLRNFIAAPWKFLFSLLLSNQILFNLAAARIL